VTSAGNVSANWHPSKISVRREGAISNLRSARARGDSGRMTAAMTAATSSGTSCSYTRRRCRHRAWTASPTSPPAPLRTAPAAPPTSESAPGSRGKIRCPSRVAAESSSSSRGGGTPGSWNLGVAHSATHRKDQRNYVDVLFAEYSNLVAAAETGDIASLLNLMNDVYVPAPDASTAKIRDAQIRAAALAATRGGSASALRLMLDRGADLGLFEEDAEGEEDRLKCTMGIECAGRGRAEVLDVLLTDRRVGGVSTECRDPRNGMTALMAAARFGHVACIAVLVDAGCDVDARSDFGSGKQGGGSTAAMMAAENGHAGALNALRAAGADVNLTREVDGKTAMQLHREKVAGEMKKLSNMGYVQGSSIGDYATEI